MKDFDGMMKAALSEKVRDVEPSEQLLANIRKEADERRKENGFMKMNMKKMMTAAAVIAALSVTCYAAGQLHSVVSHGSPNIETFAELEKAEKKLGFDAKYVETFANGMTFQRGGTGETYGMDEDGNKTGKKYKMMTVEEVAGLLDIKQKFESFGFKAIEVDGHNIEQLIEAFAIARQNKEMPSIIIAKTTKGKGISFMENNPKWHNGQISDEEYKIALQDLGYAEVE